MTTLEDSRYKRIRTVQEGPLGQIDLCYKNDKFVLIKTMDLSREGMAKKHYYAAKAYFGPDRESVRFDGTQLYHQNFLLLPEILNEVNVEGGGLQGRFEIEYFANSMPLLELWSRKKHTQNEKLALLCVIADALDFLHTKGAAHGTLCPNNILASPNGDVKLKNWVIPDVADVIPVASDIYVAPEQIHGQTPLPQSDQFSLAVVIYEALAGELPFRTHREILPADFLELLDALVDQAPTGQLNIACHKTLCRAMSSEPRKRYSSCRELIEQLRAALAPLPAMPSGGEEASASDTTNENKVWITDDIYARVDEQGHVLDAWAEGVFGCVLMLRGGGAREDTNFALKVPRLIADTQEENSFINLLMEAEVDAVWRANARAPIGLMAIRSAEADPLRKRRILHARASQQQNDHILLMCFPKNRPPRLCSVRASEPFSVYPESLRDEIENILIGSDALTKIGSNEQTTGWSSTRQLEVESPNLADVAGASSERVVWYAGLPASIYNWAPMTLQEALLKGHTSNWKLDNYITLFQKVLSAIVTLHNSKPSLLHGDLRPANILCYGPGQDDDASRPELYLVADYGSFSVSLFDGEGTLGPVVGRYRRSAFYSPERRAAIEYESANVAVVLRISAPEYGYAVCLGWKTRLTDPLTGNAMEAVVTALRKASDQPGVASGKLGVLPRDCLRLRNYVFRVKAIVVSEDLGDIYLCDQRVATVVQERLSVYKRSTLGELEILNLPNFSILKRPNPSVDVFSFGALLLYCLFAGSSEKSDERQRPEERQASLDEAFTGTMKVLESVPYLDILWHDCEFIRKELEALRERYRVEKSLPRSYAPGHQANAPSHLKLGKQAQDEKQPLYELVRTVANNILQSTPHAIWVLEKLDYNLAKFVLLIQFALSCFHYASNLKTTKNDSMSPICLRRGEEGDVAAELYRRFEDVIGRRDLEDPSLFASPACQEFCVPKERRKDDILSFDPRSDFFIRIENTRLKDKNKELEGQLRGTNDQLVLSNTTIGDLNRTIGQLQEQLRGASAVGDKLERVRKLAGGPFPKTSFGNYEDGPIDRLLAEIRK